MTDIEKLVAIEEIKRIFTMRLRFLDTKQWDMYGTVHTDDTVSVTFGDLPDDKQPNTGGESNKIVGKEAVVAFIRGFVEASPALTTCHQAYTPEIDFTSDTTATDIWPMEDHLWWRNGDRDEMMHGYGHYHENYRKVDGKWYICYRKLTRLRLETTPGFFDRIK